MDKFLDYVNEMWPEFICGPHHELMAQKFEEVADGKIKRLVLNVPPRFTKSMFASYLLPSWFLGRFPEKQVIQAAGYRDLAVNFKQRVDKLMESQKYAQVFPQHGKTVATNVGGAVCGYAADLYIVDDPHEKRFVKERDCQSAFDWFNDNAMCRLKPAGAMVVVMSRSSEYDLTARLEELGGWEVVKIPAMKSDGSSTWPEFWPDDQLLDVKRNISIAKWRMEFQSNNEAG
jgi:hypothetical protein